MESEKEIKKNFKMCLCIITNGSIFAKMGISGIYMLNAVLVF